MTDERTPDQAQKPWDKAFEPYAMEIGFLLREWNDLQEALASLFGTLLDIQNEGVRKNV